MEIIKKAFAFFAAIFIAVSNMTFGNNLEITRPKDAVLVVAMMSDTHVGDVLYRKAVFSPGVKDIARSVKPDVLLIAGDCTDNGNEENWTAFSSILEKHLQGTEMIVALGNHDTWTSYKGEHDYAPAKENYLRFSNILMGTHNETVWFTREICGYSFIVLGSEDSTTGATITDAQLHWFEAAMAEAAAKSEGKPIFVVNHQPLNDTHIVGKNEHGNGFEQDVASQRMLSILDKYKNVFLFSGHQHYGLKTEAEGEPEGFTTVEKVGQNVTSVNLPCYEYGTFLEGGRDVLGQGIVMYVYPDRIELKGRNYFIKNWLKNFSVTVEIQ